MSPKSLEQYDSEFQTRTTAGGLMFYKTLAEAMTAAKKDLEVWKVSFGLPNGERVRLTRNANGLFEFDPIELPSYNLDGITGEACR
jgi:hypothetical protein